MTLARLLKSSCVLRKNRPGDSKKSFSGAHLETLSEAGGGGGEIGPSRLSLSLSIGVNSPESLLEASPERLVTRQIIQFAKGAEMSGREPGKPPPPMVLGPPGWR